jgi:hypothetical protein
MTATAAQQPAAGGQPGAVANGLGGFPALL